MIYLLLFWEFFKTGLFAVGGGYATLPFLANISSTYGWFSGEQLANFIAISEVTPGPVGINVATFAGYITAGVFGGIVASVAVALPAVILILAICRFFPDFNQNKWVRCAFYGLLPVAMGLITVSGFIVFKIALLSFDTTSSTVLGWLLLAILLVGSHKKMPLRIGPFLTIIIGGIWGFLFL